VTQSIRMENIGKSRARRPSLLKKSAHRQLIEASSCFVLDKFV